MNIITNNHQRQMACLAELPDNVRADFDYVNEDERYCPRCGDDIDPRRTALGYRLCLWCGEDEAKAERRSWTVVPMHKSNYVLLTDKRDLHGINNKGGIYR